MKNSFFAILLAASAVAASSPAVAQDNETSFTGLRFEARGGWDNVRSRVTIPDPDHADQNVTARATDSAPGYGAEIGYDAQLGRLVVGAYGGVDASGALGCAVVTEDDLACVDTGRNITAGARAGFVVGSNLLVYARGGYSNGGIGFNYDADTDVATNRVVADNRARNGYHFGGGLELAFTPNFYGRVEYVQTRYSRLTWVDPTDDDFVVGIRARRQQATAGLGFRF
jgi:outer membrane immunogenic protein